MHSLFFLGFSFFAHLHVNGHHRPVGLLYTELWSIFKGAQGGSLPQGTFLPVPFVEVVTGAEM